MNWKSSADLLDLARRAKAEWLESAPEPPPSAAELLAGVAALRRIDLDPLRGDRPAALAFWINLYNALVIHGVVRHRVTGTVRSVRGFFRQRYEVGGLSFSLDDIEHGILRNNRAHPARLLWPTFLPFDKRKGWRLDPVDVRIHFALNCGAASCPPIRHYTPAGIERELDSAAETFVNTGGVKVTENGTLEMSAILVWYWRDFGLRRRTQLRAVEPFLAKERRAEVLAAAAKGIRYAPYDWSLA